MFYREMGLCYSTPVETRPVRDHGNTERIVEEGGPSSQEPCKYCRGLCWCGEPQGHP
jgi:hypothetical protein